MAEQREGERLRRIQAVTDAALGHLDVEDLRGELLEPVRELLGADTAAILVLDASAQQLIPVVASGIADEAWQGTRVPVGTGFAGWIAAEQRPKVLERVDRTTVLNPALWESGIQAMLGVPMLAGGSVTGVLHVGTRAPRRFTDDDAKLLRLVADRVAPITQSPFTRADRAAATVLQRSLLPAGLPAVHGLELAARYVPGVGGVGGDWYDVFPLPSGQLGIVIGDVVGRGLRAAIVMGRLRTALRAYALESDDPAEVLGKLDRKAQHFEPDIMATVLYALVEPSRDRIRLASAGHMPPVLAQPNESTRVLDLTGDLPLGVLLGIERRPMDIDLAPGAVLCLYTDGLVERRGHSVDAGVEQLRASVGAKPAETVCAGVMAELVGEDPTKDDIAVVVLRHAPGVS